MESLTIEKPDTLKEYGIDDSLPEAMGILRDYVATGLITREKIEVDGGCIAYEATYEAPNDNPGRARMQTIRITEAAYGELGTMGVP